jgi:hypothetical protein
MVKAMLIKLHVLGYVGTAFEHLDVPTVMLVNVGNISAVWESGMRHGQRLLTTVRLLEPIAFVNTSPCSNLLVHETVDDIHRMAGM